MKQIQIKNFGPISEANIRVGGLTIFAGANNAGKSFALRLIYSIVNSLKFDLYFERANEILGSLDSPYIVFHLDEYFQIEPRNNNKISEILTSIHEIISQLSSKARITDPGEISSPEFTTILASTKHDLESYLTALQTRYSAVGMDQIIRLLDSYLRLLTSVQNELSQKNYHDDFIQTQLRSNLERELLGNFRVPSIATLIGAKRATPSVKFVEDSNIISLNLKQSDVDSRVNPTNISISHYYPSNVFLESPIYWKTGVGGSHGRFSRNFTDGDSPDPRQTTPEVPAYVSSLKENLLVEYTGEVAFPEILEWINKKRVFHGKIVVATGGLLRYHDGRREYPFQTTASGITTIGIIGLLIERKLINERTVLFLDGPESNLHPAWQVLIVELLLMLAQAGIDVVLATHSVDILKFIEVSAQKDSDILKLINLNHFPNLDDHDTDFFDRITKIQNELSDPYYRMFIGDI